MKFKFDELNHDQIKQLANVNADIAQGLFISVAIPALLDRFDPILITSGLALAFLFWTLSIFQLKYDDKHR